MRLVLTLAFVAALPGCATNAANTSFHHPKGVTHAQYSQDAADCKRKSQQPVSNSYVGPHSSSGSTAAGYRINYTAAIQCMEALGYRQDKNAQVAN